MAITKFKLITFTILITVSVLGLTNAGKLLFTLILFSKIDKTWSALI